MTIVQPDTRTVPHDDDLRAFLIVLRAALLTVCVWIERRYGLERRYRDHD